MRNVSWATNQHIRMISEGSCDTEDWHCNDAENSVDITGLNHALKYSYIHLNCNNIYFLLLLYSLNRKLAPAICTDPSSPSRMFPALRSLQTNTDTTQMNTYVDRTGQTTVLWKSIIIKTYLRGDSTRMKWVQYECMMFLYVAGSESRIQTSVVMVTNSLQTIWTLYLSLCPVFNTKSQQTSPLLQNWWSSHVCVCVTLSSTFILQSRENLHFCFTAKVECVFYLTGKAGTN